MPVRDAATLKSYFNKRDVPTESNYIDLIDSMFGVGGGTVTEGPGIDVVDDQVGLGGDSFLLYDIETADPVAEYATLTLALAAATTGQVVICPAGTYDVDVTIPAGVTIMGTGKTIINGTITLGGDASQIQNLTVYLSVNQSGILAGIIGPSSGEGKISNVIIMLTNAGVGDVFGIQIDNGNLIAINSRIILESHSGGNTVGIYSPIYKTGITYSHDNVIFAIAIGGGLGYGFLADGTNNMYATGGLVVATTHPVGE